MERYIPDSLTLIMITSNIKDAFDPMMEEASDMEEEALHTYLDNLLTEFTNRLKGDLLIALIQENNEAADAAEGEDENG
jgi:hypothetical protein